MVAVPRAALWTGFYENVLETHFENGFQSFSYLKEKIDCIDRSEYFVDQIDSICRIEELELFTITSIIRRSKEI